MKIKAHLVLNKTLNYIQHMVVPVPYRLFLTKINVTEKLKFVSGRVENIVGNRRKCCLLAFSPFPTIFFKGFLYRAVKSPDCVVKLKQHGHLNKELSKRLGRKVGNIYSVTACPAHCHVTNPSLIVSWGVLSSYLHNSGRSMPLILQGWQYSMDCYLTSHCRR